MTLYLTEDDVQRLLPMPEAVAAVEDAMRRQAPGGAVNRPRQRVRFPAGTMHLMGAALPHRDVLGFKAYTAIGRKLRFLVMLYSATDGGPLALLEADHLGQIRTGAASGVATKYMARKDATVVGVIGSGYQAETQVTAMCAVRPVREVRVYSRTPERRKAFAEKMARQLGVAVRDVDTPDEAVKGCHILITATYAREPVFKGELLEKGVHMNIMGGNALIRREIDDEAVRRSDIIVVDSIEQARVESGDLLGPVERGLLSWDNCFELWQVVSGHVRGRRSDDDVTMFKSHGIALWDVAAAAHVYEQAKAKGMGRDLGI